MKVCSKGPAKWVVILTKFRDDSSKIVDFLLLVKVLDSPVFYKSDSIIILTYTKTCLKRLICYLSTQLCLNAQPLAQTLFDSNDI